MTKISKGKKMICQCAKPYENDNAIVMGNCPSKSKHNLLTYYVQTFHSLPWIKVKLQSPYSPYTVGWNVSWYSPYGKQYKVSLEN